MRRKSRHGFKQRGSLWPVIQSVHVALAAERYTTLANVFTIPAKVLAQQLLNLFDCVIIDEARDFEPAEPSSSRLRRLRRLMASFCRATWDNTFSKILILRRALASMCGSVELRYRLGITISRQLHNSIKHITSNHLELFHLANPAYIANEYFVLPQGSLPREFML